MEWPQRAGAAGAGPAEGRDAATAALAMVSRSWKVMRKATFQLFSLLQRERREGERLLDESFVAGDGWGTREPGDRGGGCVTEWPDETVRGHGTELCDGDVVMVCERALLPEAADTLCLCPVLSERPAATSPRCHTLAASPSPVLQATAAFYGVFSPSR